MSLLTIVQAVCIRAGVPKPSIVIGNPDPQIQQMLGLLESLGQELANGEYVWEFQKKLFNFVATGVENQPNAWAVMNDPAVGGIVNDTFWVVNNKMPVRGPLSESEWQLLRVTSIPNLGPFYQYRIGGTDLFIRPIVPAGWQLTYAYWLKNWIKAIGAEHDPSLGRESFTDDAEQTFFPEQALKIGLQAWWARQKGLPYAQLMDSFDKMIETAKMKETPKRTLHLEGEGYRNALPGVLVPYGNWPVT